ncbi:MAG: hypothetical protein K0B02_01655 [DPANN group archaeon]|nr:hypothetical protein [DPANN group archaeon]
MVKVNVFICDKCRRAKGYIVGSKTSKCTNCGKTHTISLVLRKRQVWHAKDEIDAKRIIQSLNWKG